MIPMFSSPLLNEAKISGQSVTTKTIVAMETTAIAMAAIGFDFGASTGCGEFRAFREARVSVHVNINNY